jgi:hypothetical protein
MRALSFRWTVVGLSLVLGSALAAAQRRDVFVVTRDTPAIQYTKGETADAVSALQRRIDAGQAALTFEERTGYLRSVLDLLKVPVESQTLVFSQTSFQAAQIDVLHPRAIYFNDTVAVGWLRDGDFMEVAVQDPRQGVLFYALPQKRTAKPRFGRDEQCLACHLSWETLGVPGMTLQSVYPLPDENSYANGFTTTHASPLEQRWGGWFVTGNAGGARHMGNITVMPKDRGKLKLANPTRPMASVEPPVDLAGFPSTQSDVVALMVLAHQTHMTNLITRTGWEARLAAAMPSADASARVREAARDLVDYLLFVDEAPLVGPVQGGNGFAAAFTARGPKDGMGRSLRDFDLRRRMFRYPCSYMIYTEAFDALPAEARTAVYTRMWEVLSGKETGPRYKLLTAADRKAVVEILLATKKGLPESFRGPVS